MERMIRVDDWREVPVDTLIDVRSPAEFQQDHIPGAINLPVLSDDERAHVGTLHKEEGSLRAKIVGAGLISTNIGNHLSQALSGKPGEWYPLIYCWRGGLRSRSLALVLEQIGWRCAILEGGYKTFRSTVMAELAEICHSLRPVLLQGATGSGKTRLLRAAATGGVQTLDLEGLANHRGSILGGIPGVPQPSQRQFETRLWQHLQTLDLDRPVLIEAESSKVGELHVPKPLWKKMFDAPTVEIELPQEERVTGLLEEYEHLVDNPDVLIQLLNTMRYRLGHEQIDLWTKQIESNAWREVVGGMLGEHYDRAYTTAMARRKGIRSQPIPLQKVGDQTSSTTIELLRERMEGLST